MRYFFKLFILLKYKNWQYHNEFKCRLSVISKWDILYAYNQWEILVFSRRWCLCATEYNRVVQFQASFPHGRTENKKIIISGFHFEKIKWTVKIRKQYLSFTWDEFSKFFKLGIHWNTFLVLSSTSQCTKQWEMIYSFLQEQNFKVL